MGSDRPRCPRCQSSLSFRNPVNHPAAFDEFIVRLPLIVVECDGHDFHEKTKQQAQRDKARDRELVAKGYRVLRFTGSEIYRDSAKCAAEVQALITAMQYPRLEYGTKRGK